MDGLHKGQPPLVSGAALQIVPLLSSMLSRITLSGIKRDGRWHESGKKEERRGERAVRERGTVGKYIISKLGYMSALSFVTSRSFWLYPRVTSIKTQPTCTNRFHRLYIYRAFTFFWIWVLLVLIFCAKITPLIDATVPLLAREVKLQSHMLWLSKKWQLPHYTHLLLQEGHGQCELVER